MEHSDNKIRLVCSSCQTKYVIDLNKATQKQLQRSFVKCKKCGQNIPIPELPATTNSEIIPSTSPESKPDSKPDSKPESIESSDLPKTVKQEPEEAMIWPQSSSLLNTQDEESDGDGWLALYGDMMSILLIFFVLMFAISTIDKQKFQSVIEGISQSLGGSIQYETVPQVSEDEKINIPKNKEKIDLQQVQKMFEKLQTKVKNEAESLTDLQHILDNLIKKSQLQNSLTIRNEQKGLVLIAQDVSMFKSGSAIITSTIKPILLELGLILSKLNIEIIVEGHTDDIPIHTKEFASNWELSTKRATNVVHFFIEKSSLNPSLISASGYVSNRPRHSFLGEDASKNRRIEIVVKKKYDTDILHDIINVNSQNTIPHFIEEHN